MKVFEDLVLSFVANGYTGDYDGNKKTITLKGIHNEINSRSKIGRIVSSVSGSYVIYPIDNEEITDIIVCVY